MTECSYISPDTEEGYGEPCEDDATENGLCVHHGGVGCCLCGGVGKEFTVEPHNSKCIAEFDAFYADADRKHDSRPFAMNGCGCPSCEKKEGGFYRGCRVIVADGFSCDGPTPCPAHSAQTEQGVEPK